MKVRLFRKRTGIDGRIVRNDNTHLTVASYYVTFFQINAETLEISFPGITSERDINNKRDGIEDLNTVLSKTREMIASGEMRDIIDGDDVIENPKRIYIVDSTKDFSKVIETYTDAEGYEFGYPHTDAHGRILYDNTTFKDRRDALIYANKTNELYRKFLYEKIQSVSEELKHLKDSAADLESHIKTLKAK